MRDAGMMLSGNCVRTKLPLPSALVVCGSKIGNLCARRIQEIAEVAGLEIVSRHGLQSAGAAQAGIIESLAEEQEGLVAAVINLRDVDRAADLKAAFVLPQLLFDRTLEETACVQLIVAEIVVDLAVDSVRAGFQGYGGEPAPETAEFGIEGVSHHSVLGHRLPPPVRSPARNRAGYRIHWMGRHQGRSRSRLAQRSSRGPTTIPPPRRCPGCHSRSIARQKSQVVGDVALLAENDHRKVVNEFGREIARIAGGRHIQQRGFRR